MAEKQKNFKLPQEVRDYHKNKEREKRGTWKCTTCGGKPDIKELESKEKYCTSCYLRKITIKSLT